MEISDLENFTSDSKSAAIKTATAIRQALPVTVLIGIYPEKARDKKRSPTPYLVSRLTQPYITLKATISSATWLPSWWKSTTNCAKLGLSTTELKKNCATKTAQDSFAVELALDTAAELQRLFDSQRSGTIDLESVETAVKASVIRFGAAVLSAWINTDRSDGGTSQVACDCGGVARRAGRRCKQLVSALGELELKRSYYHCEECGSGIFPKDRELGIEGESVSVAVQRMIGRVAGELSFAATRELLQQLANVDVSVKQAERVAERVGREIMDHELENIEVEPCEVQTMYLGVDGTGVPMIPKESEGRLGKQVDGTSKTREMKLAVVWTAERTNDKGRPEKDPGSASYNASIESASTKDTDKRLSAFAQRVERETKRRGFDTVKRQVVVGDGALWIWNMVSEIFPRAIQIVDIWHAKEKLHEVGKSIYGDESELAVVWADQRCDELDEGDVETVMRELQQHGKRCKKASQAVGYFGKNRERMRYRQFREQGICVSSGVVEAGCKDTVGARLKRSGMRWSVNGANAIAALRCYVKSDRFDDFWYDKSVKRLANEKI